MKNRLIAIFLILIIIVSFSACNKVEEIAFEEPDASDVGKTSSGLEVEYYDDGFLWQDERNEVLRLVNIERKKEGFTPVSGGDLESTLAAFTRAEESITVFEHMRPDGRNWDTIIVESGISNYIGVGENLAKNYNTPETVVDAWMHSPDHRENIMGDFTHLGVGIAEKDEIYYYTQIFVKYR